MADGAWELTRLLPYASCSEEQNPLIRLGILEGMRPRPLFAQEAPTEGVAVAVLLAGEMRVPLPRVEIV